MSKRFIIFSYIAVIVFIIVGLYLTSLYSYLLFHSIVEMFSVIVAFGIFMFSLNSRRFIDNNYFIFIGIAFLFIGSIDLIHTLSYKGMGVFKREDANLPTQLWIATQYLTSLSFLIAPFFMGKRLKIGTTFLAYCIITTFLFGSIFYWRIFPNCYIEGEGLTAFKKVSEYIIASLFLIAMFFLYKKQIYFDRTTFKLLIISLCITIVSELLFTSYINVYGFTNLVGHYLKLSAYYLIYKAIVANALVKPYDFLFRTLTQKEERLREERDRAQKYLDTAGVMFVVINSDQKISLINKQGCEILGYNEEEIIDKNWFDTFVPERIRENNRNSFIKLMNKEKEPIQYYEYPVITKDNDSRIIEWHKTLLYDDKKNPIALLCSGEDITERKYAEEELERYTEELQISRDMNEKKAEELYLLNERLKYSENELRELNLSKDRFFSIISHDLRSPFTSLLGMSEYLMNDGDKLRKEEILNFIRIINNAAKTEFNLLENLLKWAKLQTGRMEYIPQTINLLELVRYNINVLIANAEKKNIKIYYEVDEKDILYADENMINSAFQNLLSNAIKFTNIGGEIKISSKQDDDNIIISIADTGIGISQKDIPNLFRIDVNHTTMGTAREKGSGLGLILCKELIEKNKGKIWVESEIGKGSIFRFSLKKAGKETSQEDN